MKYSMVKKINRITITSHLSISLVTGFVCGAADSCNTPGSHFKSNTYATLTMDNSAKYPINSQELVLKDKHPRFKSKAKELDFNSSSFQKEADAYLSNFGQKGFEENAKMSLTVFNKQNLSKQSKLLENIGDQVSKLSQLIGEKDIDKCAPGFFKKLLQYFRETDSQKKEHELVNLLRLLILQSTCYIVDIQNELSDLYNTAEQYINELDNNKKDDIKNEAEKKIAKISKNIELQLDDNFIFTTYVDEEKPLYDSTTTKHIFSTHEIEKLINSSLNTNTENPCLRHFLDQFIIRTYTEKKNQFIHKKYGGSWWEKSFAIYPQFIKLLNAAEKGEDCFLNFLEQYKIIAGDHLINNHDQDNIFINSTRYVNLSKTKVKTNIITKSGNNSKLTEEGKQLVVLIQKLRSFIINHGVYIKYSDLYDQFQGFDVNIVRKSFQDHVKALKCIFNKNN